MSSSKISLIAFLLFSTLFLLPGCRKKNPIDGTYRDAASGLFQIKLDDGRGEVTVAGMTRGGTYTVSGNTITFKYVPGRNSLTFTRNSDGSLVDSASGGRLVKVGS